MALSVVEAGWAIAQVAAPSCPWRYKLLYCKLKNTDEFLLQFLLQSLSLLQFETRLQKRFIAIWSYARVYALTCRDDADVLMQSLLQIAAKAPY
jgi:hypothetical protein